MKKLKSELKRLKKRKSNLIRAKEPCVYELDAIDAEIKDLTKAKGE